jgi:lipopolysaccharide export system permease protein
MAKNARLPTTNLEVQYATMQSRPFLYAIMVLLAATVSLKTFRFGNIQTRVTAGLVGGFALFILGEVSRQLGVSGLIRPEFAAWVPTAVAGFASVTVLLHQEDG